MGIDYSKKMSRKEIRALAKRMLAAKGEGPWRKTHEVKPPEMEPVMVRIPENQHHSEDELPVVWGGEVWYRAWPYEVGRWHWWFEEYWEEWRPIASPKSTTVGAVENEIAKP